MTVKDGKIQYLGTEKWARRLCDENTQVLDYGDNYVYPGFIEDAQLESDNMDPGNVICHLQTVDAADIKRLAELIVVAAVAPMWMSRTDVALEKSYGYIGEQRAYYAYPQNSIDLLERNMRAEETSRQSTNQKILTQHSRMIPSTLSRRI